MPPGSVPLSDVPFRKRGAAALVDDMNWFGEKFMRRAAAAP